MVCGKLTDTTRHRFRELAGSKYVKALGEIGLDYESPTVSNEPPKGGVPDIKFPKNMPSLPARPASKEVQKELLQFELSVVLENRLPVNVHCHGAAHPDIIGILREVVYSGVLFAFSWWVLFLKYVQLCLYNSIKA